ncbi:MAG: hypothetical protein KAI86_14945, partial [Desulfobacterales bacterium]|nr:hypothetical protein [Desulfobacterales bacterium]
MKKWLTSTFNRLPALIIFLLFAATGYSTARSSDIPLELVKLPPGFKINIYATDIPNARSMVMSP